MKSIFCLYFLYQLARQDCRYKKMDAGLLYDFLAVGIGCFALELLLNKQKSNIMIIQFFPGIFFLIMGALTQEAVGYGDGLAILAMGFYMEAYVLWKVIGISLFLVTGYV